VVAVSAAPDCTRGNDDSRPGVRVDIELARRVERFSGASAAAYAEARVRLDASLGARVERRDGVVLVDGGRGAGDNSSAAFGLGLSGPVIADDDIVWVERFYEGVRPARVQVASPADPSLLDALGARGFRALRLTSTCVAASPWRTRPLPPGVTVRALAPAEIELWNAVGEATYGPNEGSAADARLSSLPLFLEPNITFLASVDGVPAGVGSLAISGDGDHRAGLVLAGMTIPAFRGRGVQSALLDARLAESARRGLALLISGAAPASTSERNLRQAGFTVAYTTLLFQKH